MNQYNVVDELQKITPLIKIVKQREELYLSLLNFINKNIESTSTQHQQLTLFTKFLTHLKTQQKEIFLIEKSLMAHFDPHQSTGEGQQGMQFMKVRTVTKNSKQMLRLAARLIEIIDTSIAKTTKSIFNEDNSLTLEFNRFKRHLHNIVKGQTVHLGQFTTFILNFVKLKYKKQLAKVEKYLYKLQSGAIVALKQMYLKEHSGSETDHFQLNSRYKLQQNNPHISQTQKQIISQQDKQQHFSESQSPKKSIKRPSLTKSSTKKGHKLLKTSKKQSPLIPETKPKQYTANKLLKHYHMLELSKKQFLEDLVFEQLQQQEHKRKLMNSLLQRNKTIQGQISTYYKKTIVYKQKINILLSSGEQKQKDSKQKKSPNESFQGMMKASSLRKSFVISKRKSSLNFQKNSKILTENDESLKGDIFIKTMKNLPVRRKSTAQTTQRSLTNKSKKLFVIKSPVVFEDDNIPQAPTQGLSGGQGWFRPPLTTRKQQKKNDNIRLKRRNNPLPIQNSLFNESFKFTDNSHF